MADLRLTPNARGRPFRGYSSFHDSPALLRCFSHYSSHLRTASQHCLDRVWQDRSGRYSRSGD
jgi:hypothetical protein